MVSNVQDEAVDLQSLKSQSASAVESKIAAQVEAVECLRREPRAVVELLHSDFFDETHQTEFVERR